MTGKRRGAFGGKNVKRKPSISEKKEEASIGVISFYGQGVEKSIECPVGKRPIDVKKVSVRSRAKKSCRPKFELDSDSDPDDFGLLS